MEIIRLTPEYASKASHIYALSWKAAYQGIVPQEYLDSLSLERWTPFLTDSPSTGFLLKDGGEFTATSSVSAARDETMPGWGEIISIYVLPQYFHKGYGSRLISAVSDYLFESGWKDIYLWVLEGNKQARAFYERNHFVFNGDTTSIEIGGKALTEIRYVKSCR